jgi:hypothetical protein
MDLAPGMGEADYEADVWALGGDGTVDPEALRPIAQAKIDCGKAHFAALGTDVGVAVANNYSAFSSELP